jgi:hypothetical protein
MQVYRLEPYEPSDKIWECSTFTGRCWVLARDAEHAREIVNRHTIIARVNSEDRDTPIQPWMHEESASCVTDRNMSVPPGVLLTLNGTQTLDYY